MPLDDLKAKYQTAITLLETNGHLENVNMDGEKLFVKGEVNNDDVKNSIWDAIKQIDPAYADLTADITVNSSVPAPAPAATSDAAPADAAPAAQTYTVQPGDTLSAIAEQFYGKASAYHKIFEANRDKLDNPDHVQVGMELVIP